MDHMVFLENGGPGWTWRKEYWFRIGWCKKELGYEPEVQASSVCQSFKFRSAIDAMAFKLRWT